MATRLRWSYGGKAWPLDMSIMLRGTEFTASNRKLLDGDPYDSNKLNTGTYGGIIVQLPQIANITQIITKRDESSTGAIQVSNDSTDGIDGTWTTVVTSGTITANVWHTLTFSSSPDCRWIQDKHNSGLGSQNTFGLWIYGVYKAPLYEFWDVGESARFTSEYPLSLAEALNSSDYSEKLQFKLKNTDSSTHDYSLSIIKAKYSTDSFVTNKIRLSVDGGSTKLTTVTVSSLGAGLFSGAIDIWCDVLIADNPADGYHYYSVEVTQTA
jgi:hypothetical protein